MAALVKQSALILLCPGLANPPAQQPQLAMCSPRLAPNRSILGHLGCSPSPSTQLIHTSPPHTVLYVWFVPSTKTFTRPYPASPSSDSPSIHLFLAWSWLGVSIFQLERYCRHSSACFRSTLHVVPCGQQTDSPSIVKYQWVYTPPSRNAFLEIVEIRLDPRRCLFPARSTALSAALFPT